MQIIGICGFIGSGKDTAANLLRDEFGDRVKNISFAGCLKDVVSIVFGWDREMLEGATAESRAWREQVDPWWAKRFGIPNLTPRWVLQKWGTDILRNYFHQDIWIAVVERKIMACDPNDIVVITDCRFPNEVQLLKEREAKIIWIQRGPMPSWYPKYILTGEAPPDIHPTEYAWLNTNFDCVLQNNGSKQDLRDQLFECFGFVAGAYVGTTE